MIIISCKPQTKTDLLTVKFDLDLSMFTLRDKELKKDVDPNLGLVTLTTQELDGYAIGDTKLTTYAYLNGNLADYNNLSIFVTSKDKNNYLGFHYSCVNQEETKAIITYLKKTYPIYQQSTTEGSGKSFFWDIPQINAWLFTYQGISTDQSGKNFFSTNFIFVKKTTRMANSMDPKAITVMHYYKMMYPDVIK